jgi:hypothetical protein
MLGGQIEPMLQRELQNHGLGVERGGFSTKLIGWVEVRGKGTDEDG